jgi:hypothetical protein
LLMFSFLYPQRVLEHGTWGLSKQIIQISLFDVN